MHRKGFGTTKKSLILPLIMKMTPSYSLKLRLLAIVGLLLSGFALNAQFYCTIRYKLGLDTTPFSDDATLCYKQPLTLYTGFSNTLNYKWEPGGETSQYITTEMEEPIKYLLTVYNDDSSFFCQDSVIFDMYPKITVAFEQISKGCPNDCKAQVKATASGGMPPYRYSWAAVVAPNDSSLALGLCTDENANLLVYDTLCIFDTAFLVEGYDMPEIEVTMSPDSLYNTNPEAIFSYENKSADSIPLSNWTWVFPDSSSTNLLSPDFVFTEETDSVLFIYQTVDGCTDTIFIPITVNDFKLELYNVFTPNGDGINDTYEIPNLDRYISNQFIVFNRWGERVFEAKNYDNDWDGGKLPDGVYYYILKCQGYWEEDVFRGSVSIYGSKY